MPKMAAKLISSAQTPSYDEFEPFCNWCRDERRDTLVLHLPQFKKEQVKIQINNFGVLKISGEQPLGAAKRSLFFKEIKVSNECKANDIHAKFVKGLSYVIMPKKIAVDTKQKKPSTQQGQVGQNPNGRTSQDDERNLPSQKPKCSSYWENCNKR